ncbi:MAG: hypothetical protein WC509_00215 [Candidatus Izemoplasmatales bacterium]
MKENLSEKEKQIYETPAIEVVVFTLEESIATSGDFGSATLCGEEIY